MKPSTEPPEIEVLRETIINNPELVLNDTAIMQSLVSANDKKRGGNIIDLRYDGLMCTLEVSKLVF